MQATTETSQPVQELVYKVVKLLLIYREKRTVVVTVH